MAKITIQEQTDPSSPSATKWVFYPKTTGLYFKDSAGNVVGPLTSSISVPGGRLTLTSGTPVTTADVTGATSVYYTPYVHNKIALWNGVYWQVVEFTETTLALGTITSGLPYDVFGYLSSGALALEKLAWTNTTTRATGISLQDGRYCKTGDKTRLYLGTFYTTSTTQTEDSAAKRDLFNMYNRVVKQLQKSSASGHTYTTTSWRAWNNDTANKFEFIAGLVENMPVLLNKATMSGAASGSVAFGLNWSSGAGSGALDSATASQQQYSNVFIAPVVGYNSVTALEFGATTVTFSVFITAMQWLC